MYNASPVQQQRGSSLSLLPLTVELSRCHQLAGLLQSDLEFIGSCADEIFAFLVVFSFNVGSALDWKFLLFLIFGFPVIDQRYVFLSVANATQFRLYVSHLPLTDPADVNVNGYLTLVIFARYLNCCSAQILFSSRRIQHVSRFRMRCLDPNVEFPLCQCGRRLLLAFLPLSPPSDLSSAELPATS
ncbi:hypothetical protein T4D_11447 [Trichinella pseudospiralis]|uniref:Uncharacterized protein n=1 Tax=Trichinella pseudospiralis TaxID=6337 RepID=A0A0V1F608_TRIPS|nr:hypothetical protein T4D_11447 [Trichinella pseudospiralis]